MVFLIGRYGGDLDSRRRDFLVGVAVRVARFRYWAWGGIFDAGRLAWKGNTALAEFLLGLLTMVVGTWWAVIPQPYTSTLGRVDRAFAEWLPHLPLGVILGLAFASVGRN